MKNTTSIKVPKKYQHMIEDIYPDSGGNGYWCHSKEGYGFEEWEGAEIIREDTQALLLQSIRTLRPHDDSE
ncbi:MULTISPECIES: hypothetical protein [Bacillus amyloliquefaciens group]|uniref:hypothetical protein n=1 Tax=Bacillus amyloliquefaciens group TaxID=1938374 RepID=UPI0010451642|nr:hypothetical protein [Bacillus velezensis]MCY0092186.1 hypothetical protein [Bacillus velezensis]